LDKHKLLAAVRKDSEFLKKVGLMDYSMLLAMESKPQVVKDLKKNKTTAINDDNDDIEANR